MGNTKNGDDSTRQRILTAAAERFALKGFAQATVRDICAAAGVNLALVNYHFRSKAGLYRAVWEQAIELADHLYPIEESMPNNAPAEERLRACIRSLLSRMTDQDRLGHFHRLRMAEFANPTGLLGTMLEDMIARKRAYIFTIIRDLLDPSATDETVELCEMSIISQCLMARPRHRNAPIKPPRSFSSKDVDLLTKHIGDFSMAGIRALHGKRPNKKR